jgi:hypothetical protein
MAANTKNKFPADKSGTKYADFRNTRRVTQHKTKTADLARPPATPDEALGKTS